MKKIFFITIIVLFTKFISAQNPIFTNNNSNNAIYNPALSGLNSNFNALITYRQIYPNVTTFSNYGLNISGLIQKPLIGIGLTAYKYYEANGSFVTNVINFNFNKILKISHKLKLSLGVSAGYLNKSVDISDKILSSQLDPVLGDVNPPITIITNFENINKLNIVAGLALKYNNDKNFHILSFSINHLNSPNISFIDKINYYYPMFVNISYYSAIKLNFNSKIESYIRPKFLATFQTTSSNFLLGADYVYSDLMIGTHLRVKNFNLKENTNYLGLNIGLYTFNNNFLIVYTFETPIINYPNSGGLHELALIFNLNNKKKSISCGKY